MTHLRKTTQQNYRVAMQDVLDHFVLWPIGKIEHGDVAEWVAWVSKTKGVMGDLTGAASHQSQADVGGPRQAEGGTTVVGTTTLKEV